eukprot:s740_g15.t1
MASHEEVEEGKILNLDWEKLKKVSSCESPVIPVAVQSADSKEVLIVAFANEQALMETLHRRVCVLWSTSRNQLWIKGSTSGDVLDLVEVRVNCEQNSLLYLVRPRRTGACHTKGPDGDSKKKKKTKKLPVRLQSSLHWSIVLMLLVLTDEFLPHVYNLRENLSQRRSYFVRISRASLACWPWHEWRFRESSKPSTMSWCKEAPARACTQWVQTDRISCASRAQMPRRNSTSTTPPQIAEPKLMF